VRHHDPEHKFANDFTRRLFGDDHAEDDGPECAKPRRTHVA
jgi:hypothetical protein